MGKKTKADELNCSGCGYDNCRAYAVALLEGKAERQMCISQMRKEAQNQASVLLRKMRLHIARMAAESRVYFFVIAVVIRHLGPVRSYPAVKLQIGGFV